MYFCACFMCILYVFAYICLYLVFVVRLGWGGIFFRISECLLVRGMGICLDV